MNNCFSDCYIGLKNSCKYDASYTGSYVNDIPEVSLARLASLSDDDTIRGEELFKKLHDLAIKQVSKDLTKRLGTYYNSNVITGEKRYGDFMRPSGQRSEFGDGFEGLVGLEIVKYDNDKYTYLHIESIEHKACESNHKTFYIIDGDEKTEYNVKIKKGINKISLNYSTQNDRIYIAYNACDSPIAYGSFCNCSQHTCNECDCSCIYIRGVEECNGGWNYNRTHVGFTVCASCRCSSTSLACDFINELEDAVLQKFAILFNQEILNSDRNNPLVRNSKDEAQANIVKLLGGTQSTGDINVEYTGMYWEELDSLVERIKNSTRFSKSKCFSCEGQNNISVTIP